MAMEWVFAAALAGAFVGLTAAFNRPEGRPLRTRGASRAIRWDAPSGR